MNTEIDKSLQAIMEIAADWFVRSREAELSLVEQKEFAHWLNESPLHVHEYLTIARMWGRAGEEEWVDWADFSNPLAAEIFGPAVRLVKASVRAVARAGGDPDLIDRVRGALEHARREIEDVR